MIKSVSRIKFLVYEVKKSKNPKENLATSGVEVYKSPAEP